MVQNKEFKRFEFTIYGLHTNYNLCYHHQNNARFHAISMETGTEPLLLSCWLICYTFKHNCYIHIQTHTRTHTHTHTHISNTADFPVLRLTKGLNYQSIIQINDSEMDSLCKVPLFLSAWDVSLSWTDLTARPSKAWKDNPILLSGSIPLGRWRPHPLHTTEYLLRSKWPTSVFSPLLEIVENCQNKDSL